MVIFTYVHIKYKITSVHIRFYIYKIHISLYIWLGLISYNAFLCNACAYVQWFQLKMKRRNNVHSPDVICRGLLRQFQLNVIYFMSHFSEPTNCFNNVLKLVSRLEIAWNNCDWTLSKEQSISPQVILYTIIDVWKYIH